MKAYTRLARLVFIILIGVIIGAHYGVELSRFFGRGPEFYSVGLAVGISLGGLAALYLSDRKVQPETGQSTRQDSAPPSGPAWSASAAGSRYLVIMMATVVGAALGFIVEVFVSQGFGIVGVGPALGLSLGAITGLFLGDHINPPKSD